MIELSRSWKMKERLTAEERMERQLRRFEDENKAVQISRRSLIQSIAATAAVGAIAGCGDNSLPNAVSTTGTSTPSATDVLQFALNLEYFEAQFYGYVANGAGLSTSDTGTAGTVTGGAKVTFQNAIVGAVAGQLATNEREHVEFLRSTLTSLGVTPVNMPNINLAAGGAVNSDATFLAAARRFETVGQSAYAGGAQYLTTNTAGLTYAAQILHVESQHEAFLRELCLLYSVTSPAVDSLDIPPSTTAVFNTNANGLVAVRTPSQVLQILYNVPGQTGVTAGAFFPNGLSGNIVST